jgi:hypothetical protein
MAIPPSVPAPHMKLMTMTTITAIASSFRCDAVADDRDHHDGRCPQPGSRYRAGRWLCRRCFALVKVGYTCGDRQEAKGTRSIF